MENINTDSFLHEIEAKILETKKEKVKLLGKDKNHPDIPKIDARTNSLVLFKSELIKENKSNEYHLTKNEELKLLTKMANIRKENVEAYANAKRNDLADAEQLELDVLNEFLPKMPSEDELKAFVASKIDEYLSTKENDYKLSMRDMKDIKTMVNAVYSTLEGGMIKDVLMTKING